MSAPFLETFAGRVYRTAATGLCWVLFGAGGLLLTATWFPWLNVSVRDAAVRRRRARSAISRSFRLFLWFINVTGVARVRTAGIASLARSRGVVIAANHPTLLDYVYIASELPEVDCVVKAALARNFFLKGVVKAAGYILNSEDPSEFLAVCRARIGQGAALLIFPEGTRTRPGVAPNLRRGAAQASLASGCPVELVRIACSEPWLTKGAPWHRIPARPPLIELRRVGILNPCDYGGGSEEERPAAARRMTAEIARHLFEKN